MKTSYPSIQALPLDTIGIKDFSKGAIHIDTSMPAEYAHIVDEADTEDEYITNPRDLYKKFSDVAAKDFGALNSKDAPAKRWTARHIIIPYKLVPNIYYF